MKLTRTKPHPDDDINEVLTQEIEINPENGQCRYAGFTTDDVAYVLTQAQRNYEHWVETRRQEVAKFRANLVSLGADGFKLIEE